MSYAVKTDSNDLGEITRAANHFVIFDVKNVIACHDFEFIDVIPDYMRVSCHGHFNKTEVECFLLGFYFWLLLLVPF